MDTVFCFSRSQASSWKPAQLAHDAGIASKRACAHRNCVGIASNAAVAGSNGVSWESNGTSSSSGFPLSHKLEALAFRTEQLDWKLKLPPTSFQEETWATDQVLAGVDGARNSSTLSWPKITDIAYCCERAP